MNLKHLVYIMVRRLNDNKMSKRGFQKTLNKMEIIYNMSGVSFSQNFEDLLLLKYADEILETQKGFYVDIGAHDPVIYSNTYQLYLKGWHGINIDPLPESKERFDEFRPTDINLNIGISNVDGSAHYYEFTKPAYNTLDEDYANRVLANKRAELKDTIEIQVRRLSNVLEQYLRNAAEKIDILNIDVEMRELDVLSSNNWDKYRPRLIVMESGSSYGHEINEVRNDPAVKYMMDNGYFVIAKAFNAVYLIDSRLKLEG